MLFSHYSDLHEHIDIRILEENVNKSIDILSDAKEESSERKANTRPKLEAIEIFKRENE